MYCFHDPLDISGGVSPFEEPEVPLEPSSPGHPESGRKYNKKPNEAKTKYIAQAIVLSKCLAYIDMLGIKKILEDLGNLMAASDELFESIQNQTILKPHQINACQSIARTMVWPLFGLQ